MAVTKNIERQQSLQVVFDTEFPPEIANRVYPLVEKWSFLIPDWVYIFYLFFNYDSEKDGTCISNNTTYEYRRASLTFYAEWLRHDFFEERAFVHDLIHTFYGPLYIYASELVDKLIDKDNLSKQIIHTNLNDLNESITEDWTRKILEMMEQILELKQENSVLVKQLVDSSANKKK
jgi:hypothetical protein